MTSINTTHSDATGTLPIETYWQYKSENKLTNQNGGIVC